MQKCSGLFYRIWQGDTKYWSGGGRQGNIHKTYRAMLLHEGVEIYKEAMDKETGRLRDKLVRKGMSALEVRAELKRFEEGRGIAMAKRLRWRLRYLTAFHSVQASCGLLLRRPIR